MVKATRKRENNGSESDVHTIKSSGEIFSDGSSIELITSPDGETLLLLYCTGERTEIAREIRCGEHVYQPVALHSSLRRALRFPTGIVDCVDGATLFREIVELQQEFGGVSEYGAFSVAAWDFASWLADVLPSPPLLLVSGSKLSPAITLFRLNRCLCRRGLVLAEISRSALASLPMELRPTIMVAQPELSDRFWSIWTASNHRGTFIPGPRGTVLDVVGSRALFTGPDGTSRCTDNAIHISLPPECSNIARLDDRQEKQIAAKYLPQLLRYRVDFLRRLRDSGFAKSEASFSNGDFAGTLKFCLPDGPAVTDGVGRLVRQEEEDRERRLACDLGAVIVEVLWTKLQDSRADLGVSRIADFANAILRLRGENREYSAPEVGWQLRQIGIPRHSGRDGNSVRFSQEIWRRVHELAQIYRLRLPPHPNSCLQCARQGVEN